MAETQNEKKPVLYSFYDKQFDYNDLARSADAGLNNYIGKLKRGDKDSEQFHEAYSNLMSGIKDGTITYNNGSFYDSKGRYTSSDKKNKDYYGLMANYILKHMGKSDEYTPPAPATDPSKISWSPTSLRTALNRALYGHDTGNIQDFLDLDTENDGVRGTTNRTAYLARQLRSVADNWDSTFQGYTDTDKNKNIKLLTDAASALEDGTIDAGDYLALSKAVGGMDFRSMMTTGEAKKPVETGKLKETAPTRRTLATRSFASVMPDSSNVQALSAKLQSGDSKNLIHFIQKSLVDGNYSAGQDISIKKAFNNADLSDDAVLTAILLTLKSKNYLKQVDPSNPNLYYIPYTRKNNRGWVWDMDTNSIEQYNMSDLFTNYKPSKKNGGVILKGKGGLKVSEIPVVGEASYIPTYTGWAGINDKGVYGPAYTSGGTGFNSDRYKPDATAFGKGTDYVTAIEGQDDFKDSTVKLLSDLQTYLDAEDKTKVKGNSFLYWADNYGKALSKDRKNRSFFDENGNMRKSWTVTGKDATGKTTTRTFDNPKDYLSYLRSDHIIGPAYNDPQGKGIKYVRQNTNGKWEYLDPTYFEGDHGYVLKNMGKRFDNNIEWDIFAVEDPTAIKTENTGQKPVATKTETGGSTVETRETGNTNDETKSGIKTDPNNIFAKVASARRVLDSINTNNRITEIIRKSMQPVLQDTYELYSPVTGAFSEMQLRNRQATDLRRQAARPVTSDASLSTAASLDANEKANELEYKGFLADDAEIKRTKDEALKRQEDNVARRSAVANYNRKEIDRNNRELAQLEATRLSKNFASRDNFNQEIERELKENAAYNKNQERYNEIQKRTINTNFDLAPFTNLHTMQKGLLENYYNKKQLELENANDAKIAAFQAANGRTADYSNEDWYKTYLDERQALLNEKIRNQYEMSIDQGNQLKSIYSKVLGNPRAGFNLDPLKTGEDWSNRSWYKIINMDKWTPKNNV